jgi:hypothetical protein
MAFILGVYFLRVERNEGKLKLIFMAKNTISKNDILPKSPKYYPVLLFLSLRGSVTKRSE